MRKLLSVSVLLLLCLNAFAQQAATVIKGTVFDKDLNEPIVGATVVLKGTSTGTTTDFDGHFSLKVNQTGEATITVSFVGMTTKEMQVKLNGSTVDLKDINLASEAIGLNEVQVLASVAIDRQTPVAVSTIKTSVIEEKLGAQEFPEILKSTPGVYATKQGGGFGDARVNIRGFSSENVAVMINGVPINDMEGGTVYWSNWAGLADVTRTMQVQRGLGASKVAVPSVGGTINILTKTTDAQKGGSIYTSIGNNQFQKLAFTASTGLTENKWAITVSGARTKGNNWVDGAEFEGWSYFANISKQINSAHTLSLTAFGAPQVHGQRSTRLKMEEFKDPNKGLQYNSDWGYKNGQVVHLRENFYHKPQISLNHYWTISDKTELSTAAYVSFGTGGGTGSYGDTDKFDNYRKDGQIDFDRIVDENIANGHQGSESIIRASRNDHNWYGILSSLNTELTDNITFTGGLDLRYYKGRHFREVTDLLGGEYYIDEGRDQNNINKVAKVGDKIDYHNDGEVLWEGVFAQAEYSKDKLSAFVAASVSNTSYRRIDYFNYLDSDPEQTTDWQNFIGYMAKGGANYNLTTNHNVFANVGYFEKAPFFNSVFRNYRNDINEDAKNERVMSFELGYGYRSKMLNAKVNLYRTSWLDKSEVRGYEAPNGEDYTVNLTGVDAIHQGVEVELTFKPAEKVNIRGMASVGDWLWADNLINQPVFDNNRNLIGYANLFIKDLHVGDAAQTTASLGVDYEFMENFKVGVDYNYADNYYAYFTFASDISADPISNEEIALKDGQSKQDSWKVPSFGLLDLNVKYDFKIGNLDATLTGNVNNLLDTEYISDAQNGDTNDYSSASVFYGVGRTWTTSLKIKF
ncbi:TonB-dependent receptor [Limibacter armeniacum]|uniref:TonB-dependent receptor n=1 Tax=Limibacter armeniacum TaxID=466084 RepID=UPI002FE64774